MTLPRIRTGSSTQSNSRGVSRLGGLVSCLNTIGLLRPRPWSTLEMGLRSLNDEWVAHP